MSLTKIFKNGLANENPVFVQVIGMCPVLAVTTSAINGLAMGLATTAVLTCSNLVISMIRKFVSPKVRIPAFIVVIATFVTLVDFLMKAYTPGLNKALGLFIPLIVVNCTILARAESFASKNGVVNSFVDGVGMGLGFTIALLCMGIVREILGNGSVFNFTILPDAVHNTLVMIMAPGAFFTLGFLMALIAYVGAKKKEAHE